MTHVTWQIINEEILTTGWEIDSWGRKGTHLKERMGLTESRRASFPNDMLKDESSWYLGEVLEDVMYHSLLHYLVHCFFCIFTQLSLSRKLVVQSSHLFDWLVRFALSLPYIDYISVLSCSVPMCKWEVISRQPFRGGHYRRLDYQRSTLQCLFRIILGSFLLLKPICMPGFWCRAKFSVIYILYI